MKVGDFFLVDEALLVPVVAVEAFEEVVHDSLVEVEKGIGAVDAVLALEPRSHPIFINDESIMHLSSR